MLIAAETCTNYDGIKAVAEVAAVIAAGWGVYVYFSNSRVRRAEWLCSLYEKFYERSDLKEIREVLDCRGGKSPEITRIVGEESARFTDYLNFFEFVAVLRKSDQLTEAEIEDLFGYYLDCLEQAPEVRHYVAHNGYEQLEALLRKRTQAE